MRATELFAAIKAGDLAAVERALTADRSLVDARDETGLSPVLAALYRGKDEIASAILHRGPSLSVFEAAAAGDVAIVRALPDAGADPNARNRAGRTSLHTEAFTGDRAMCELLLGAGGDGAIADGQGKTPVDIANDRGNAEVALLLRRP